MYYFKSIKNIKQFYSAKNNTTIQIFLYRYLNKGYLWSYSGQYCSGKPQWLSALCQSLSLTHFINICFCIQIHLLFMFRSLYHPAFFRSLLYSVTLLKILTKLFIQSTMINCSSAFHSPLCYLFVSANKPEYMDFPNYLPGN